MKPDGISNADRVAVAIQLLREARNLLREAGSTKALDRVRLALTSAQGAYRHAQNEPYRLRRQNEATV